MAGQIPGGADDAPDLAIAELSEETTPPFVLCAGGCGCGTGGSGRPNHLGTTFRRFFAPCLPFCSPLTASACFVSFALSGSSLAVGCLCALRRLPLVVFCVTGHLRAWSGRLWARWRRFCALTVDSFRWLEGAEGHRRVWSAWCALLPSLFCAPLCVRLCLMCGAKPCWRGPPGGVLSPSRLLCHQCGTRSIATPSSPSTVVAMGHQPL